MGAHLSRYHRNIERNSSNFLISRWWIGVEVWKSFVLFNQDKIMFRKDFATFLLSYWQNYNGETRWIWLSHNNFNDFSHLLHLSEKKSQPMKMAGPLSEIITFDFIIMRKPVKSHFLLKLVNILINGFHFQNIKWPQSGVRTGSFSTLSKKNKK